LSQLLQYSSGEEILFIKTFTSQSAKLHNHNKYTHFNWVNIMGDDDELSLLLFNQLGDGVATSTENALLLGWCFVFAGNLSFGLGLEAGSLLELGFGTILLQDLEQLDGGLLVQCLGELVDWWRDLQALLQDSLVALDANVLGPSDETRQVTFWLDALA